MTDEKEKKPAQPAKGEPEQTKAIVKPKDQEDFVAMEKWDEGQIVKELEGQYLEDFVYFIEKGKQTAVGLSYAGVKEVQRQMAESGQAISLSELKIVDDGRAFMAQVKATNRGTGVEMYGVSNQDKMMQARGGEFPDPFALQKAVSKAQRNAIRAIIPEKFAAALIAKRLADRKGGKRTTSDTYSGADAGASDEGWKGGFETADQLPPQELATAKQAEYFKTLAKEVQRLPGNEEIVKNVLGHFGVDDFSKLDKGSASKVLQDLEVIKKAR